MRNRRRLLWIGGGLAVVAAAVAYPLVSHASRRSVPVAAVKRGDFVVYLPLRCEIKSLKSKMMTAPAGAGGDLQILKLARTGETVKKGDVVVQFDTSTLQRTLDQKSSELKQADGEIEKAKAQARLDEEKTLTDLTKARYDLDRARLDAQRIEILSAIDGEKARLAVADAEQKVKELETKLASDRKSAAAEIKTQQEKRKKALFEVNRAERNLAAMVIRAPEDGTVTRLPNFRAGRFFSAGAPEFKEGDRAWPGAAIIELPDMSSIRATARVDESDRGRLAPGQSAVIHADAIPDKDMDGSIERIGAIARVDFSTWPPPKNFDVIIKILKPDARLRPGMNADTRVAVETLPGALIVPAEAVFQRNGENLVYVQDGSRFKPQKVKVLSRNKFQAAVEGELAMKSNVALKDPTLEPTP
jgi:multidrug resistance efflux pump